MVYLHESCMDIINQKQASWESLVTLDKGDAERKINQQTKQKMLLEYEEKTGKQGSKRHLSRIPLWYFLHEILEVDRFQNLISWENPDQLIFTIKKPKELAVIWGQVKNRDTMTYAKLARGIRYYYGKGVIEKHHGKRFSYQFVVSKKTKSVLCKNRTMNYIKQEQSSPNNSDNEQKSTITEENQKQRKRKSSNNNLRVLKRSRSNNSTDSMDRSSIGSDDVSDNDNEFSNLDQWSGLESYLEEIMKSDEKMDEILTDYFQNTDDSSVSNENFPSERFEQSSSPVCSMVKYYTGHGSSSYCNRNMPEEYYVEHSNFKQEKKLSPSGIDTQFGQLKFEESVNNFNSCVLPESNNFLPHQISPQQQYLDAYANSDSRLFNEELFGRRKSKSESDCRVVNECKPTIKLEPPTPQFLPCSRSVPDFTPFSEYFTSQSGIHSNDQPRQQHSTQLQHQESYNELFELPKQEDFFFKDLDSIIFDDSYF